MQLHRRLWLVRLKLIELNEITIANRADDLAGAVMLVVSTVENQEHADDRGSPWLPVHRRGRAAAPLMDVLTVLAARERCQSVGVGSWTVLCLSCGGAFGLLSAKANRPLIS